GISKQDIQDNAKDIFKTIYQYIPVGFNVHPPEEEIEVDLSGLTKRGKEIAKSKKCGRALGSLGGGNHFLEIGYDETDTAWIVIHSGSRGVGHGLASHYMTLASSDPAELAREFDESHKNSLLFPSGLKRSGSGSIAESWGVSMSCSPRRSSTG
ncbi:MAG: RtcB family protein, partial [Pirellulales bacterium]|nr:RtcB family protein [Pirellulales bacterium]